MYIVGQYPRFLNIYFKFLQVLIQKLFEFMNDRFPGVQVLNERCEFVKKKLYKRFIACVFSLILIGHGMRNFSESLSEVQEENFYESQWCACFHPFDISTVVHLSTKWMCVVSVGFELTVHCLVETITKFFYSI